MTPAEPRRSATSPGARIAPVLRWVIVGLSGVSLFLAFLHHRSFTRGREKVLTFARTYWIAERWPDTLAAVAVEPAADLMAAPLLRVTMKDMVGSTPLRSLTPAQRDLWIQSVASLPRQHADATNLALDGLAARPGWALSAVQVADLRLAAEWRDPASVSKVERWLVPMRIASRWAPADRSVSASWAVAALQRWPLLSSEQKSEARKVISLALESHEFVSQALPLAATVLGASDLLELLPDRPETLALAQRVLSPVAPFDLLVRLHERWEVVERARRKEEQREITNLLARDRRARAAARAREWLQKHPVRVFDDAQGRAQARALVPAIADGATGEWASDPRGDLIRYFLDGPQRQVERGTLLDVVEGLQNVPDPVRARLLFSGGDYGWRKILENTDTAGSVDWTPFFVDMTRRLIQEGKRIEAAEVAGRISRFSQRDCEVLLVRRELARLADNRTQMAELERLWPEAFPAEIPIPAGAAGKPLTVCLDPEQTGPLALEVSVDSPGPALVWTGWDGGREQTHQINGATELSIPLAGLSGRRIFGLGTLVGAEVSLLRLRLVPKG